MRTYWNLQQAGFAKSLLDRQGIFCRLGNVNAHLYGGAPFIMPIELLVAENDAVLAHRRLVEHEDADPDHAEAEARSSEGLLATEARPLSPSTVNTNPWRFWRSLG